jgi:hypothetical protein
VKTGAGQTIVKIQGSTAQVRDARVIDEKLEPVALYHCVSVFFLVQRHLVVQTRAAAFGDPHAQALARRFRMRCKQIPELSNRVVRDVNHNKKIRRRRLRVKGRSQIRLRFSSQLEESKLVLNLDEPDPIAVRSGRQSGGGW